MISRPPFHRAIVSLSQLPTIRLPEATAVELRAGNPATVSFTTLPCQIMLAAAVSTRLRSVPATVRLAVTPSELLQGYGVDPITVAAQTGMSVAMIEKAYLRFIPSAMQEKLAALKG